MRGIGGPQEGKNANIERAYLTALPSPDAARSAPSPGNHQLKVAQGHVRGVVLGFGAWIAVAPAWAVR